MPRRQSVQLSLFPFMSVLACTIGALTLLLVSMAVTSVGATRLPSSEQSLRADELEAELPRIEAGLERLEREWKALLEAEARWAEVDAALEARGLEAGRSEEATRRALRVVERQTKDRESLRQAESELARIEKTRDAIEASIEVLESRRRTLPILIDATGLSRQQQPYFVECDAHGLTAFRVTDDFEYFVPLEEVGTHGVFKRYLRRVRATPGALLVLLVRANGIPAMERAVGLAREAGVRVARMPLPGEGELDWRLLRQAEQGG
jgi:hypothetical protein